MDGQSKDARPPPRIIGKSRALKEAVEQARVLGPSSLPVLIEGESGTGKELIGRAIHAASGRGPLVPVNVAAISHELVASELFGHVSGAFTGAHRDKKGLFEAAHGGTLFLDEVGDAPTGIQVALLRALDQGTIRPVGSTTERRVDVRVLAATHQDLDALVGEGRFREDLFARLAACRIRLPPLRERPSDIEPLARYFLDGHPIRPAALEALQRYPWPRNVRELRDEVERARHFAGSEPVAPSHLSPTVRDGRASVPSRTEGDGWLTLEAVEEKHIRRTLARFDGNQSRAAEALGIHRTTLARKIDLYGLDDPA